MSTFLVVLGWTAIVLLGLVALDGLVVAALWTVAARNDRRDRNESAVFDRHVGEALDVANLYTRDEIATLRDRAAADAADLA